MEVSIMIRDFIENMFLILAVLFGANAVYILATGEGAARWFLIIANVLVSLFNGLLYRVATKNK